MAPAATARGAAAFLVAGAALAGGPPAADAQTIGRLFSTVEERIALDELRLDYEYGKPPPRSEPAPRPAAGPAEPVVPQVTVNGIVLRSSGNNASWINGSSILSGDSTPEGIKVEPGAEDGGSVRLVMPSGIEPIVIKPGQKIDVVTGNVVDAYQFDARESRKSVFEKDAPDAGGETADE